MKPDEIAALAAAERERAAQDLMQVEKWCSGREPTKYLQSEYRARRAKTKRDTERDSEFASAVEGLRFEAMSVLQSLKSGHEVIHSYGQVVARAAQLMFITWSDTLKSGVEHSENQSSKGSKGAAKRWSKDESKAAIDRIIERLRKPQYAEWTHTERWNAFLGLADDAQLNPSEHPNAEEPRKTYAEYDGGKIAFGTFRNRFLGPI